MLTSQRARARAAGQGINWKGLLAKRVPAPLEVVTGSAEDTRNFDAKYTSEAVPDLLLPGALPPPQRRRVPGVGASPARAAGGGGGTRPRPVAARSAPVLAPTPQEDARVATAAGTPTAAALLDAATTGHSLFSGFSYTDPDLMEEFMARQAAAAAMCAAGSVTSTVVVSAAGAAATSAAVVVETPAACAAGGGVDAGVLARGAAVPADDGPALVDCVRLRAASARHSPDDSPRRDVPEAPTARSLIIVWSGADIGDGRRVEELPLVTGVAAVVAGAAAAAAARDAAGAAAAVPPPRARLDAAAAEWRPSWMR